MLLLGLHGITTNWPGIGERLHELEVWHGASITRAQSAPPNIGQWCPITSLGKIHFIVTISVLKEHCHRSFAVFSFIVLLKSLPGTFTRSQNA